MTPLPPRNPYQPPEAALADAPRPPGSPLKAVLYGVLVDVGGSLAAGLVLVFAYSVMLAASGVALEDIQRAVGDAPAFSGFSIVSFLVGMGTSVLGGYVCARIAGAAEAKPVGIVATVSALASLLMGMSLAFDWNALLALTSMGAVFAGGWLGARRNARRGG